MASLKDLLIMHEMKVAQDNYTSDAIVGAFQNFSNIASQKIMEQQQLKQQQQIQEENNRKVIQRTKDASAAGKLTKISYGADGGISATTEDANLDADALKLRREERLGKQYSTSNAIKLGDQFDSLPEVKDYITSSTSVDSMDSLLKKALEDEKVVGPEQAKANYLAIDQALITMFNKLTDPQSVVRESEYARTGENLPLVNKVIGAIGKIQAGGAGLTNEDRLALVEGAKIIRKERGNQYNQTLNNFNQMAVDLDLPPDLVTRKKKPFIDVQIVGGEASGNKIEIATDINGRQAEVEVDSKGNIIRVIRELP